MRPSHLLPPVVTATVAAAPISRLARLGLSVYGSALIVTAARADPGAGPVDRASLPVVFATMHLTYGLGLFAGVRRYGVPVAAMSRAFRRAAKLPIP